MQKLHTRKSVRNFAGTPVSTQAIQHLLWSCYGMTNRKGFAGLTGRTIPSAGGLFPLIIHLTLFKGTEELPSGSYRFTSTETNTVSLELVESDTSKALHAFLQQRVVRGTAGAITISGCISRSASKYANRGLTYTLLEAGHAAQNIHLAAVEEGIATLEMGGFLEEPLCEALRLNSEWQPLAVVVFGNESTETNVEPDDKKKAIGQIIERVYTPPATANGYTTPFQMVFAESKPTNSPDIWNSCGRSPDPALAVIKATAEAVEWYACTRADKHDLISASLTELGQQAIHPESLARYAPDQLTGARGITRFDEAALYKWLPVVDVVSGEERVVLADFVYFPYTPPHGKRYAFANSSGTAAHITPERAFESALLELAEREAFMVTWFNHLLHPRIVNKSLPESMQRRIHEIEVHGFQVTITDMTMGLTPVAHVGVMRDTRDPKDLFFCSSAASDYDFLNALDRALMESEASVYCRMRDGAPESTVMPIEQIQNTDEHAGLYQHRRYMKKAQFLMGSQCATRSLAEVLATTRPATYTQYVEELLRQGLRVYAGNLTERDTLIKLTGFHVMKAFVPGMVPMTFGYNVEPILLDRVRQLPVDCKAKIRPTPLNRLNRLPHPYN